jgi:ADP-ribose pyrophosphatase YjhB (NUDIX family)
VRRCLVSRTARNQSTAAVGEALGAKQIRSWSRSADSALDDRVVPIPAGQDDARLEAEPVDQMLDPLAQISPRLAGLIRQQRRPVGRPPQVAEFDLERVLPRCHAGCPVVRAGAREAEQSMRRCRRVAAMIPKVAVALLGEWRTPTAPPAHPRRPAPAGLLLPDRSVVTADLVVLTLHDGELGALLIRRGAEPYAGKLALPGGFTHLDEGIETAAYRELKEEVNVGPDDVALEQLMTYGAPERDPRMRVVSVAWLALGANLPEPTAGSDAAEAFWVPMRKALRRPRELAFRSRADPKRRPRACPEQDRILNAGNGFLPAGVHRGGAARGLRGGVGPQARSA